MSSKTDDGQKRQKKGAWDPADMHKPLEKVLNNEMSPRQAAERY